MADVSLSAAVSTRSQATRSTLRERFAYGLARLSDGAGGMVVEEVTVGGSAQEPGLNDQVVGREPAQCLHHMDPAPTGNPFCQPDQRVSSARRALFQSSTWTLKWR